MPGASREEGEREDEVISGNESGNSRVSLAPSADASERFARTRAANRQAQTAATRQAWELEKEKGKRLVGRLKRSDPRVAYDSVGEDDSSDESKSGRHQFRARSSEGKDSTMDKIPGLSKRPSSSEVIVWMIEMATMVGNNERKIAKMKASPRKRGER